MSAIAKVLLERGESVSGSDLKRSRPVTTLEAMGASVSIGHDAKLVEGATTVVVSTAIPESNPEVVAAREAGIPVVPRGQALARILEDGRSVVVAGTHGKTTTTSMIASALTSAGADPTYLVGGGLNDAGTNARAGRGDISVAESDESDGSFLHISPFVAVITNVELDHVDHWASLEDLMLAFTRFMQGVQAGGAIVVPTSQPELVLSARATAHRVLTFGDGGDVAAGDLQESGMGSTFEAITDSGTAPVAIPVPGGHNVSNSLAAIAACLAAGFDIEPVAAGLSQWRGVERRFQERGSAAGVTVIDDYAHHPTEVRATLSAAAGGDWRRRVAVFQPHRYSRTAALAERFGAAFEGADRVVITEIYGAGESPVPGVTGKLISDAVCRSFPGRPVAYMPRRDELIAYLGRSSRAGDLILTMGAGDITTVGDEILEVLSSSPGGPDAAAR